MTPSYSIAEKIAGEIWRNLYENGQITIHEMKIVCPIIAAAIDEARKEAVEEANNTLFAKRALNVLEEKVIRRSAFLRAAEIVLNHHECTEGDCDGCNHEQIAKAIRDEAKK